MSYSELHIGDEDFSCVLIEKEKIGAFEIRASGGGSGVAWLAVITGSNERYDLNRDFVFYAENNTGGVSLINDREYIEVVKRHGNSGKRDYYRIVNEQAISVDVKHIEQKFNTEINTDVYFENTDKDLNKFDSEPEKKRSKSKEEPEKSTELNQTSLFDW